MPLGIDSGLVETMHDFQIMTKATRGNTGIFHVNIDPRKDEGDQFNLEDWHKCVADVEKEFNLTGQPRAVVMHSKNQRKHIHVMWQLTDMETCKLKPINKYKLRLMKVANDLTHDLGLGKVNRKFTGRSYTRGEQLAAERRGEKLDPAERKQLILDLWKKAPTGADFVKFCLRRGYQIATGDKAKFVLIHRETGELVGNLLRHLKGVKLREVQEKLRGLYFDKFRTAKHQARIKTTSRDMEDSNNDNNREPIRKTNRPKRKRSNRGRDLGR